ncbi:hypothetical protein ACN38_g7684 [Penicillium nordicum]|uniref:Uncharacterized protein n=1 Tax=Penicillium nordicum TaxID=229535 RepID=A0A0M8P172_9EURO|nr:hypothetical protein ACN38_g7684 [Penicillium nordicum]
MTTIPCVTPTKPRPTQGTAPTSISRQLSTRRFIVILVLSFEVRITAPKCTTLDPTPVSNATRSVVIIDMKANVPISSPELDILNRVKTKSTITILKGSTPLSDNAIHPQPPTSTPKVRMA